ncbi:JAB domain-containing protein [Sphingobium sp. PNB]|uniref:JAB domain-containing protein n=1 Tax=Sphingobium sp. PNB TaxID=863934 RepID=UPI0039B09255
MAGPEPLLIAAPTAQLSDIFISNIKCLFLSRSMLHNHPAGTAEPSRADRNLTQRMMAAAQPLAVTVHDHLVICRDGYVSFRKAGLM